MAETVKGIQDAGVIACAKHFIANEQVRSLKLIILSPTCVTTVCNKSFSLLIVLRNTSVKLAKQQTMDGISPTPSPPTSTISLCMSFTSGLLRMPFAPVLDPSCALTIRSTTHTDVKTRSS